MGERPISAVFFCRSVSRDELEELVTPHLDIDALCRDASDRMDSIAYKAVAPHLDYEGAAERARIRRQLDRLDSARRIALSGSPLFVGMDLAREDPITITTAQYRNDGGPLVVDYEATERADRADCGLNELPLPPGVFNKRARRYLLTRRIRKREGLAGRG